MQVCARTPASTAMTAMSMATVTNERFLLGLGSSGPQVVEGLVQAVALTELTIEPDVSQVRIAAAEDVVEVLAIQVDRPEWWMTFCYPMTMFDSLHAKLESGPRPL